MFATLMANVAVILIPIYIYFRSNLSHADKNNLSLREWLIFVGAETLVGMTLFYLAVDVMGLSFDARTLYYSISLAFLGWQVTFPSMILEDALHLFISGHTVTLTAVFLNLLYVFLLYFLKKLIGKRLKPYPQIIIFVLFHLIIDALPIIFGDVRDFSGAMAHFGIEAIVDVVVVTCVYLIIEDFQTLREMSDYDHLTRLLNTRKFKERLVALDKSKQSAVSIAYMDFDLFKQFNDTYGHAAGDTILWGIAQVFSAYSSNNATIYRIGGDEFAVIMTGMSRKEAELFIADIMDNVVNRPIPINREVSVWVTISVGLAYAEEGDTMAKLCRRADNELYRSKANGRNQFNSIQET